MYISRGRHRFVQFIFRVSSWSCVVSVRNIYFIPFRHFSSIRIRTTIGWYWTVHIHDTSNTSRILENIEFYFSRGKKTIAAHVKVVRNYYWSVYSKRPVNAVETWSHNAVDEDLRHSRLFRDLRYRKSARIQTESISGRKGDDVRRVCCNTRRPSVYARDRFPTVPNRFSRRDEPVFLFWHSDDVSCRPDGYKRPRFVGGGRPCVDAARPDVRYRFRPPFPAAW